MTSKNEFIEFNKNGVLNEKRCKKNFYYKIIMIILFIIINK